MRHLRDGHCVSHDLTFTIVEMFNRRLPEQTPTMADVTDPTLPAEPAEVVAPVVAPVVAMTSSDYLQARHTLIAEGRLVADLDVLTRAASQRADLPVLVAIEKAISVSRSPSFADPLRHGRDRGDINRTRQEVPTSELDRARQAEATAQSLHLLRHDAARGRGYSALGATSELAQLESSR